MLLYCDLAVQLLQGFHHTATGFIHGLDAAGGCLGGSNGGDIRHLLLDGSLTQIAVIAGAVRTHGCVDDQIHLSVGDQIVDIGSSLIQFIYKLRQDARVGEDLLSTLGCQNPETGSQQVKKVIET